MTAWTDSTLFGLVLSLLAYALGVFLNRKTKLPLLKKSKKMQKKQPKKLQLKKQLTKHNLATLSRIRPHIEKGARLNAGFLFALESCSQDFLRSG